MYHSALSGFNEYQSEPLDRFESEKVTAFTFDLEEGVLPEDFNQCDFFYSEPPWQSGYSVFNERVGKTSDEACGWGNFYKILFGICANQNKPVVMATSPSAKKFLPKDCDCHVSSVKICAHSGKDDHCAAYSFNHVNIFKTTDEIQANFFTEHDVGGDFCCGYGNVGKTAGMFGKRSILSDINPHCVAYIKDNHEKWYN